VQVFGKKKTSIAVAICKRGVGLIKVNGQPLAQLQPEILCQSTSISQTALFFPKSYGSIPLKCRTRLKKCAVLRSLPYDLNTNPTTFLLPSIYSHRCALMRTPRIQLTARQPGAPGASQVIQCVSWCLVLGNLPP
jgi:hypothetical protein